MNPEEPGTGGAERGRRSSTSELQVAGLLLGDRRRELLARTVGDRRERTGHHGEPQGRRGLFTERWAGEHSRKTSANETTVDLDLTAAALETRQLEGVVPNFCLPHLHPVF